MTDNDSYLPLSDPTATPNYPKKSNLMVVTITGGSLLAIAVIAVLAFTLRSGLHKQFTVQSSEGGFFNDDEQYMAFDTKNIKAYVETLEDDVTGRIWYIGNTDYFYFHNDTTGTECVRFKNQFLSAIFSTAIQTMLPPDDAEKMEKMKVGEVQCTNYRGTKIAVYDNHEYHQEMEWCIKDKFVHKLVEVGDDDGLYIKNHKKVSYKYKNFYPNTVCKTYVDDESVAESFHMRKALALLK
ncbi:hypothetical protein P9112_012344 [Eukaryota sp. TZLM1-RC]